MSRFADDRLLRRRPASKPIIVLRKPVRGEALTHRVAVIVLRRGKRKIGHLTDRHRLLGGRD